MTLRAECTLCRRDWSHDSETTCCYWCGCKKIHIFDKLPTGEEFADEDTIPNGISFDELIKDLD